MPRTPTTPAQVSGHRFLVRRVEHALVRADAAMLHDPQRTRGRALAAGAALAALAVAGSAVLGLVRPDAGSTDDADLLLVRGTGALHVRVGDRLHPAANLASARLVLGRPETPRRVGAEALEGAPRLHVMPRAAFTTYQDTTPRYGNRTVLCCGRFSKCRAMPEVRLRQPHIRAAFASRATARTKQHKRKGGRT